ncbi:MAG: ABC transporter ATP-binding protein [Victivallales bacterium]|nr:ABC transporter ATP-binding protein [Victivallales bacterium]
MAFLEVNNLHVWFPIRKGILNRVVGYVRAVDGVSLTLEEGETLGLVGESGCGKTTLGRAILGLEKVRSGQVFFDGAEFTALPEAKRRLLRKRCQMIFQDPFASLNPRMTVLELVTEGLKYHGLLGDESLYDAGLRLLNDVGLGSDALYRYPHEFSGGQRQRISIARALSLKPSLIICDEPVSALDVSVQAQVINLLMDLRDKYHLSYIFISHDLSVVKIISQKIAVMYLGHIVETGPASQVMEQPLHPYTQALLSAVPVPGKTTDNRIILKGEMPSPANPPTGCPFHPRCPRACPDCAKRLPEIRPVSKEHSVACDRI